MPRHRKGWTKNQFFDNREIHRRRPLAMNPQPSNTNVPELALQPGPPNGNTQISNGTTTRPPRQNTATRRGTSFVRDSNGVFQTVQALLAPRAVVPGIMESYLHRLGLQAQTIDTGAQGHLKQTPMGPLELVGTAVLELRLRNQTLSRGTTVQVWRGDETNRYKLYFDPANGSQFLKLEGMPSPLPHRLRLDHPPTPPSFDSDNDYANPSGRQHAESPVSPNSTTGSQAHTMNTSFTSASEEPNLLDLLMEDQVFPQGSWGFMSTTVLMGNNSTAANQEDAHLATPLDFLTTPFVPGAHSNHHHMAPDGFCHQCFDDALSAATDAAPDTAPEH